MFIVDVDPESGINTVHKEDCFHLMSENHPEKEVENLTEAGGYLEFETVGAAVRHLKENRVSGLIRHCPYCKPAKRYNHEPAASLGVEIASTGCEACNMGDPKLNPPDKTLEVTDTKTIWKRLSKKLLGSK